MISKPPKKLIIIEGISASGKTTIQKLLETKMSSKRVVKTLSENTTLMPLVKNKSPKTALTHLQKLLSKMKKDNADAYITDRFHLTHIFRTGGKEKYFKGVERSLLKNFDVLVVLLVTREKFIKRDIEDSLKIRKTWAKGKRGTLAEKVAYYGDQQTKLLKIARESNLPVFKINTTDKDWGAYIQRILKRI